MVSQKKIAVAVSGGGRSLEGLLESGPRQETAFNVAAIICSNLSCRGFEIARAFRLPIFYSSFKSQKFSMQLLADLENFLIAQQIDLVALAGFIRPFPILDAWRHRVINIHPALLPKFGGQGMYGARVHEAVIAAKEARSGATVHFVDKTYDSGSIVAQASLAIDTNETGRSLADRVFDLEKKLYPKVISEILSKDLPLKNGEVKIYEL